jgi:hypothetical protein
MDITTQRQIDQLAHDVERLRKADTALTGVRARIYNSVNESISNSTVTTVTWNSNRYDPTNIGDANGYTIVTPGAYHVGAGVRWAANATGQRVLYIILNGATFLKINAQQVRHRRQPHRHGDRNGL